MELQRVIDFYDDLGEREWDRLDAEPRARVIFHLLRPSRRGPRE